MPPQKSSLFCFHSQLLPGYFLPFPDVEPWEQGLHFPLYVSTTKSFAYTLATGRGGPCYTYILRTSYAENSAFL